MKLKLILASFLLIALCGFCCADADLSVTVSDSQDPVMLGTNFNYIVVVTNNGPGAAENVVLNDSLNSNGTFQSIAAPEEWKCTTPQPGTNGSLSCTTEKLASGKSATFTLTVKPTAAGMLTNTASVSSSVPDPNEANNSDYEDTTVLASPGSGNK